MKLFIKIHWANFFILSMCITRDFAAGIACSIILALGICFWDTNFLPLDCSFTLRIWLNLYVPFLSSAHFRSYCNLEPLRFTNVVPAGLLLMLYISSFRIWAISASRCTYYIPKVSSTLSVFVLWTQMAISKGFIILLQTLWRAPQWTFSIYPRIQNIPRDLQVAFEPADEKLPHATKVHANC